MNRLAEREAQALAVTPEDINEVNEENPIVFATTHPNRFRILTYFFPEEDGVKIQEDLDTGSISVEYFTEDGSEGVELTEGALYEWALEQYRND